MIVVRDETVGTIVVNDEVNVTTSVSDEVTVMTSVNDVVIVRMSVNDEVTVTMSVNEVLKVVNDELTVIEVNDELNVKVPESDVVAVVDDEKLVNEVVITVNDEVSVMISVKDVAIVVSDELTVGVTIVMLLVTGTTSVNVVVTVVNELTATGTGVITFEVETETEVSRQISGLRHWNPSAVGKQPNPAPWAEQLSPQAEQFSGVPSWVTVPLQQVWARSVSATTPQAPQCCGSDVKSTQPSGLQSVSSGGQPHLLRPVRSFGPQTPEQQFACSRQTRPFARHFRAPAASSARTTAAPAKMPPTIALTIERLVRAWPRSRAS